jgi:hypothetical protein
VTVLGPKRELMQYHPSQYIPQQHETLFSDAILKSLTSPNLMLGDLPEADFFDPALLTLGKTESSVTLNYSQKLGHLYEEALLHLLESTSRFKVVTNNFQINNETKQTLGELDFLLLDTETNSHIHLELAVKFYLVVIDGDETLYPGPDARDNYHRKVARLREHQLILASQPVTKKVLTPLIGNSQITAQQLVHGIFFDHINASHQPVPEMASPNAFRRKWLYCSELSEFFPKTKKARVLPKQLWLCEITEEIFQALVEVPLEELIELGQQRCTMFVIRAGDEPLFLAPDKWPNVH